MRISDWSSDVCSSDLHANLLHHFGSASGLQNAVVENMARHLVAKIGEAVPHRQHGQLELDGLVDIVLDPFGRDGSGRHAIWMILTGEGKALGPVFNAFRDLIGELNTGLSCDTGREVEARKRCGWGKDGKSRG